MLLFILIGGLIGLFAAGPIGAILGAVAGGWLGNQLLGRLFGRGLEALRGRFLDSTFAVMGALCKADGRVTDAEIGVAEQFFTKLALSPEQRRAAQAAFRRGKADDFDLDRELAALRAVAGRSPALMQFFVEVQISAIVADGVVTPEEHALFVRVARSLGVSEADLERLEAMLRGSAGATRPAGPERLASAYATLGVEPGAGDAEVKRAYRRLMSQHHPDKLAARGLPESMRPVAEEKTREIREAFEIIREQRES